MSNRAIYGVTYDRMTLCALTPERHEQTCGYWYTVTTYGMTPHTAFRTRAAALAWLGQLGLSLDAELPAPGTHGVFPITGSYRRASHLDVAGFALLDGELVPCMDNGQYTVGVVTSDSDGLRTLHHLNCNLDRPIIDHATGRRIEDAGETLTTTGQAIAIDAVMERIAAKLNAGAEG